VKTVAEGQVIRYRKGWGDGASYHRARIKALSIMVTRHPEEAVPVPSGLVDLEVINKDTLVLDLDDGGWCYGYQLAE